MLRAGPLPCLATLAVALLVAAPAASAAGAGWLVVESPGEGGSETRTAVLEVRGQAGPRLAGTDLVIVLDLSDSTLKDSGVDLDEDGPEGRTDPALLEWIGSQEDAPIGLVRRLQTQDFEDTILAAQLEATAALIERLDLRRFRVGLVVFSDEAELLAPVGSPKLVLERTLEEIRLGFFRHLRGTYLAEAIEVAHEALVNEDVDSLGDRRRAIVLLSDGAPTLPPHGDRAERASIEAAMSAGVDGVRVFPFSIGPEGERARELLREVARWSGGRHQHVERPYETALRVRELDLTDLAELRISNSTTGKPARAQRTFPDGTFDAIVVLAPGRNEIRVRATHRDGTRYEVSRTVHRREGEAADAELAEALRLMQELRKRTREMELWADLEKRRREWRREIEIEAIRPENEPEAAPGP